MKDQERRDVERSGAFMAAGGTTPTPVRTLLDEYHDTPEPEDSDRVPDPEPEGIVARVVHTLTGKHPHDRE